MSFLFPFLPSRNFYLAAAVKERDFGYELRIDGENEKKDMIFYLLNDATRTLVFCRFSFQFWLLLVPMSNVFI